jgi:hypothetical protein
MRVAPEMLGAPTLGGGSARHRGVDGESHRSQISLPSHRNIYKNGERMGGFTHFLAYKSPKTTFFS